MGSKPLLLIHARGDDQIPSEWSEELYERARRAAQADPRCPGATIAPRSTTRSSTASRCAGSSASSAAPTKPSCSLGDACASSA